ncbi:hypothetical protein DAI22_05g039200 [Oryza sativa Japonica Group]|nr:hypothetical protein DAI22_05g039200 [Oryza sativa Japonica Group]
MLRFCLACSHFAGPHLQDLEHLWSLRDTLSFGFCICWQEGCCWMQACPFNLTVWHHANMCYVHLFCIAVCWAVCYGGQYVMCSMVSSVVWLCAGFCIDQI